MRRMPSVIKLLCAMALLTTVCASSAFAVQSWSCVCNGHTKRFIAPSNTCVIDARKRRPRIAERPGSVKPSACSAAQWDDWKRRACLAKGCKPNR